MTEFIALFWASCGWYVGLSDTPDEEWKRRPIATLIMICLVCSIAGPTLFIARAKP